MLTVILVTPDEGLPFSGIPHSFSLCSAPNLAPGDTMPHDTDATASGKTYSGGDQGNLSDPEALIKTPLPLGKTLIIYHPHAQHPPEIIDTTTLSLTREPQPSSTPTTPWAPFKSRDDFEQAELFIKHNCTNSLIDDQLHLNQKRDLHPDGPPSMKNAREMHKILEEARSDLDIPLVC